MWNEIYCERILQKHKDGISILQNGKIVYANHAFCTIIGHDKNTLLNALFEDILRPVDQKKFQKAYSNACLYPDNTYSIEISLTHSNEPVQAEVTLSLLTSGQAPLALIFLADITSSQQSVQEMQLLKDRLESILHSMHDAVISFSAEDRSVLSINPAAESLYGTQLSALENITEADMLHFVHPDDRDRVNKFYKNLNTEEFGMLEYRIINPDASIKWVRDEGYIVYCRSRTAQRIDHVIRDITDRKKTVDALFRSEQKYRDFFHGTKDMAFCISPEGTFLDINDAGVKLLGFASREEALHSDISRLVGEAATEEMLSEIKRQGFVTNKHVHLQTLSGYPLEIDITARAKTDDAGNLLYYEGIATNITQALENQRNRVLRHAAGGMCHYLNTHLMHMLNAQGGLDNELDELEEKLSGATHSAEKERIWAESRMALKSYSRDIALACHKATQITKAFNSAFLTYREEAYLDKAILDIFNAYQVKESQSSQK